MPIHSRDITDEAELRTVDDLREYNEDWDAEHVAEKTGLFCTNCGSKNDDWNQ